MDDPAPAAPRPFTTGPVSALSRTVSLACLWIAGAGLVAMTLIICWQVVARYGLNASPSWSEQLALYLLVWTVLFAAAAGVREQFHIRITLLQDTLARRARLIRISTHAVTALIGAFLAIYGWALVDRLWLYAIPTLGLPRGSAFLPMPIAGIAIVGFSLEHIGALLTNREVRPVWP